MPGNVNAKYVNPDQTFSHLSRGWEKQLGSKAGKNVAAAGGGRALYVEHANGRQKPTKRGDGELPSLKNAVQTTIAEVRAAIDHEHKDLKVGNQRLSDYVLSDLKTRNGVMTLSNDALGLLNTRVRDGLSKASYRPEIARLAGGPAPNRAASSDIGAGTEAAEVNYIASNWNKLASSYQIMRNAIAADLREIAGCMNARQRDAAFGPDALKSGDDVFLGKADDVIARAGVATTGLTNSSVDRVRECLLTTPQYNVNLGDVGEPPQLPEFAATQALYGKAVMSDSINANNARLTKATKETEGLLDLKYGSYEQKKSAIDKLKSLIAKSRDLSRVTEENQKAVLDENDPEAPVSKTWRESIAESFRKLAVDIYNSIAELFQSPGVWQAAADGGVSYEDHDLAERISSVANLNYSYAKSLTPENEKPVGIAADLAPVYNDDDALTGDWARNEMKRGGLLGVELKGSDVLYKDPDFAAREINSGHGDPVETYNKRITEVRDAYNNYLHNAKPETLSKLGKSIDDAIASGNRLGGHMEKHNRELLSGLNPSLKRMDNNIVHNTLDTQASLLSKLSVAVDIELSRIANDGVVDKQINVSNVENSDSMNMDLVDAENPDVETEPADAPDMSLEERTNEDLNKFTTSVKSQGQHQSSVNSGGLDAVDHSEPSVENHGTDD